MRDFTLTVHAPIGHIDDVVAALVQEFNVVYVGRVTYPMNTKGLSEVNLTAKLCSRHPRNKADRLPCQKKRN